MVCSFLNEIYSYNQEYGIYISIFVLLLLNETCICLAEPVGGGFEWVRVGSLEPTFWPPKGFIYAAYKLYILSVLPFESGPLISLLLRVTAIQTSLVTATVCKWGPARNARLSCLRRCDERTHINTCVNKSLVQVPESCPSSDVSPPAVLPTSVHFSWKFDVNWLSKCIHG